MFFVIRLDCCATLSGVGVCDLRLAGGVVKRTRDDTLTEVDVNHDVVAGRDVVRRSVVWLKSSRALQHGQRAGADWVTMTTRARTSGCGRR